jgi:hypothetical protein
LWLTMDQSQLQSMNHRPAFCCGISIGDCKDMGLAYSPIFSGDFAKRSSLLPESAIRGINEYRHES